MARRSLAITASSSHHDDLLPPSVSTNTASTPSTPTTSPSTGYSSLLPGSLSSVTSESMPCAEYRSGFGLLTSGSSSVPSPVHESVSSRSPLFVSPRSRSITEPDAHPQRASRLPFRLPSHRPSTAPHSPLLATFPDHVNTIAEHHTRSPSRLTASIKSFLSSIPSSSRSSFNSSTAPSDNDLSFHSFQVPPATTKWSMTSRKSRLPNLDISGAVAAAAVPSTSSPPTTDVHRRYVSEAAGIYNAKSGTGQPTNQPISGQNVPPVLTPGREPKTRNVLRRRPSGSAKLLKARERGMSTPSRPHQPDADLQLKPGTHHLIESTFPLTPAGAVVEAYKQQELHRDDTLYPPNLSFNNRMSPRQSHDAAYDRDSPALYSTVLASSERRVQPDVIDDRWGKFEAHQLTWNTSRATLSHQPSASDPSGHAITRRVSVKWRKAKGGRLEESPMRGRGHSRGRPSLQEMWRSDKSGAQQTGRCMDDTGDCAWPSAIPGPTPSGSEKEGGKFWQLMRRLSTGGLRDRFQSEKVVPPVPAIPKELLERGNQSERGNERVSMSRHQTSPSLHDKDHTLSSKNIFVARPSVAIASTSSNSSDVASTQFFHRTRSARSSISSYGEAVVATRIPEIALHQHIIAPLEQLRLGEDHADTTSMSVPCSPRQSSSIPGCLKALEDAEGELVLFSSPRRRTCLAESPPSTTSPLASGSAHVQSHQSQIVGGIVSLSPPPRPSRNSRRGESIASSPSHSLLVRQVDSGIGIGARQLDRTSSTQSDMTARAESFNLDQDAFPPTRAGITFRELSAPRRPPLSEREKVNIWNELLDRSDKAGGTLHINGEAGLMSDTMRFSTHSEI